jgi:SAM-dependent methyltransferase
MSQPSDWVCRWAAGLPRAARVLDVACGGGRHLRWLHAQGFGDLTALDRNEVALSGLTDIARTVVADIESGPWPLPGERFDAVIVTNYLWRPLVPTLLDSVAPGGWLICETFAHGQAHLGRPSRPEFLLQPGELLTWVSPPWRVVAYEDGLLRNPDRCVQRMAAVRETPASTLAHSRAPLFL